MPGAHQPRRGWASSGLRIGMGRALLATSGPLSASDFEPFVAAHQSNIKKEAERMAAAGLIRREVLPPGAAVRRGPRPEAFGLSPGQREQAARELGSVVPLGLLEQGQAVVTASVGRGHTADLLEVLAQAEATAAAAWVALLGDDLLVAYSGPDASGPALELEAVLEAADVPCRRATVARIGPGHDWAREGRKVTRAVNRARDRQRSSGAE
jgi:hypothetical protein